MSWLAMLSFLLLLVATFLLSTGRYVWDAALFMGVALTMLTFTYLRRRSAPEGRARVLRLPVPLRPAAWIRSGALLISAVVALGTRAAGTVAAGWVIAWAGAVVAFAVSVGALAVRRRPAVSPRLRLSRAERWGLGALVVAAFLVRGVALGRVPANLGGDEGTQLVAGLDLVGAPLGNPFGTGWYSVPTMSFFAYGVVMRLAGATLAGGRLLSALVGTLTVLTTFLLGRSVGGRRVGWIAAVVMAFSAYPIHFSRLASNQVADPFFGTATLWLLWSAIRPGRRAGAGADARWGLAGLVAGLGWYGYFGARWVTFMAGLVVLWRWLAERDLLRRHARGMALCAVGFLVAALPLLGWYTVHPSALTERYNAVSIFGSGWLDNEVLVTGRTRAALLLQQAWRAASAFHVTPDPTFWYRPQRPLLDFVTGALMLLGLVEALVHIRWPSRALTLLWFASTLVMAWVVTENPPSSQRGLLLMPAVALLVAWGAELLDGALSAARLRLAGGLAALAPAAARLVVPGLLLVAAVLNLSFYFGIYTPQRVYGNPTAEAATVLAQYVQAHPAPVCAADAAPALCPGRVYFLGPPYVYWGFGTLAFMLRDVPGVDVLPGEWPDGVTTPARFVLVPERLGELSAVQLRYPGGTSTELRGEAGQLLMVLYDWVPQ